MDQTVASMTASIGELVHRYSPTVISVVASVVSLSTVSAAAAFMFRRSVRTTARKIEAHLMKPVINVQAVYAARNQGVPYTEHHRCSIACLRGHAVLGRVRLRLAESAFGLLQREGKAVFHAGSYHLQGTEPRP